ncbi:hypothetical protein [Streptomyces malaysiensis]|uniref:hypothetical protein n=1 Tax=Streptomyces malaysiensis TaxID=92644 RepID=UPI0037225BAE
MTVQALYHYFPNRDALITALIAKAYEPLADALQAAVDTAEDNPAAPGMAHRCGTTRHPPRARPPRRSAG